MAVVPVFSSSRSKGAVSPGPIRLCGPLANLIWAAPLTTSRAAELGGMGKVVPGVCSELSPAPVLVSWFGGWDGGAGRGLEGIAGRWHRSRRNWHQGGAAGRVVGPRRDRVAVVAVAERQSDAVHLVSGDAAGSPGVVLAVGAVDEGVGRAVGGAGADVDLHPVGIPGGN